MRYPNVTRAVFLRRPNRFIAEVEFAGRSETVHVKNTGRCAELLLPGAEVWLTAPGTEGRKTAYDLIAVRKTNGRLVNIDSQAPNRAAAEWLTVQGFDSVRPEVIYGTSRLDFGMELAGERYLLEVKGCTLERNGIGYFPDAPTARGARHLRELAVAAAAGYRATLAFVIQMNGVERVLPNTETDPDFGRALAEAESAGVRVMHLTCHVEPDSLTVTDGPFFPWP